MSIQPQPSITRSPRTRSIGYVILAILAAGVITPLTGTAVALLVAVLARRNIEHWARVTLFVLAALFLVIGLFLVPWGGSSSSGVS